MVEKYSIEDDSEIEALEGVTDWPVIVLSDLGTRESRVCSINSEEFLM